jgi:hypothetical protein
MDTIVARKMHRTLEAYHGMIYFSPEALHEYQALGIEHPVTGYFASRASPMGAVSAEVVVATFFNFNPAHVEAAMAGAWEAASPAEWVAARMRAVDASLRRHLGDSLDSPDIASALEMARAAADACWSAGRPLAAGLLSLSWPEPDHLALWHAISILREFRGDGHIAVLVESGVSPREALLLHVGVGEIPDAVMQATRAWPDDEWADTRAQLVSRGLLNADGMLTESGSQLRADLETRTDWAALAPWASLGPDHCAELRRLVRPFSRAIAESGAFAARDR